MIDKRIFVTNVFQHHIGVPVPGHFHDFVDSRVVCRCQPGAANRAFEILRDMMFRAEEWSWRERDTNPCLGIRKNARNKVARFLDADALERLGGALDACSNRWPEAVAAIRLLALTGCRRGEVLDLRWRNVAGDALKLKESKVEPCSVPLGAGAYRHAARRARPGHVPVPAPGRRSGHPQPHRVLAYGARAGEGRQAARTPPPPHDGGLRPLGRRPPRRVCRVRRPSHRRGDGRTRRPAVTRRGVRPCPIHDRPHFRPRSCGRRCNDCRSTPAATAALVVLNGSR